MLRVSFLIGNDIVHRVPVSAKFSVPRPTPNTIRHGHRRSCDLVLGVDPAAMLGCAIVLPLPGFVPQKTRWPKHESSKTSLDACP
jgi:hypothetical protein